MGENVRLHGIYLFAGNSQKMLTRNAGAIRGTVRGTMRVLLRVLLQELPEKLYQELGFESFKDRRWLRWLCYLHKIVNTKQPAYLYNLIPPFQRLLRN